MGELLITKIKILIYSSWIDKIESKSKFKGTNTAYESTNLIKWSMYDLKCRFRDIN